VWQPWLVRRQEQVSLDWPVAFVVKRHRRKAASALRYPNAIIAPAQAA
jgi:hypothetical protein